jgi:hypothetical protein
LFDFLDERLIGAGVGQEGFDGHCDASKVV